jgi:predicted dehydrogenase
MKMRFGIIGAGGMGRLHSKNLLKIEDTEIAWVADLNPEAGKKLAEEVGSEFVRNWEKHLDKVDAVVICTPPFVHCREIVRSASAGKHIFVEKPLALTMRQADRIVKTVRENNVQLMVGYVLRFFPSFKAFKEILDSGRIGELVVAWINRMGGLPRTSWLFDPKKSGGMTVEFNTHDIDFLLWLGGKPSKVYGKILKSKPDLTIEDNVWAIIDFPKGIGVLGSSWSNPLGFSAVGIIGTKGVVIMKDYGKVIVKEGDKDPEEYPLPQDVDPYYEELLYFVNCLREGKLVEIDAEVGRNTLQVCLAVQNSSKRGTVIRL